MPDDDFRSGHEDGDELGLSRSSLYALRVVVVAVVRWCQFRAGRGTEVL